MLRPRGLHLPTIAKLLLQRNSPRSKPLRLFLCIADHYEPMNGSASSFVQEERVSRWIADYPRVYSDVADSRGRPPQHTFFYPAECYLADEQSVRHVERIAGLCRAGFGDVEVHLHHDNDTSDNLRTMLLEFTSRLHDRHGLLQKDNTGKLTYGFVHGNWALDNSRRDGRWCGVNDEITILLETGCYADFTMPSAPADAQTRTINSIYYAVDDPSKPNSHDSGTRAALGVTPPDNSLLLVQGPLQLDWKRRRLGVLPGIENADLHGSFPPTEHRFKLWRQAAVSVLGREDWIFIKLHTPGGTERNANMLLGERMREFHDDLASQASSGEFQYYYVSAREMAELVHQAERGEAEPQFP
jgi:hypothetical protein